MLATENKLNAKMLSMENFSDWILIELEKRGWSQSDLVKSAGISRGTLSNIISGTRGVGIDSMVSIANAMKISPITVFRKAGLLPPGPDNKVKLEDWEYLLNQMTEDELEEFWKFGLMKVELRQQKESSARAKNFKQGKVKK